MWAYVKHFDTFAHGLTESLRHPMNFDTLIVVDEGSPASVEFHTWQLFKFRNARSVFGKSVTVRHSCSTHWIV